MGVSRVQWGRRVTRVRPSAAMSKRSIGLPVLRRVPGMAALCLGLCVLILTSPAARALGVSPAGTSCSSTTSAAVKQGVAFDVCDIGFSVDANSKVLVWGSGPFPEGSKSIAPGWQALDVALATITVGGSQNTYAYLAESSPGGTVATGELRIINVTAGSPPSQVAVYATPKPVRRVVVSTDSTGKTFAYLAEGSAGLEKLDVSNPIGPVRVKLLNMSAPVNDVALDASGHAYVALDDDLGLRVVDVATMSAVKSFDTRGGAHGVTLYPSASQAFVAEGADGLEVFDISNLTGSNTPIATARVSTPGFALRVAVPLDNAGQCVQVGGDCDVYVADREGGLAVVDVTSGRLAGSAATLTQARDVYVSPSDNLAYVADYGGGLYVFHIAYGSNPQFPLKPQLYSTLSTKWSVTTTIPMTVHHGLAEAVVVDPATKAAYLAAGTAGLQIIDVSGAATASPMFHTAALGDGATVNDVAVLGQYAYLAAGYGFKVIPTSALKSQSAVPAADIHTTPSPMPDVAMGVTLASTPNKSKTYAYVADRYRGLQIVDVTSPTAPTSAGVLDTLGKAVGVDIPTDSSGACVTVQVNNTAQCYAYMADLEGGVTVVDIHDPTQPSVAASVPMAAAGVVPSRGQLTRPVRAVRAVKSDTANVYVAFAVSGQNGLQAIEVDYPDAANNLPPLASTTCLANQQQLPSSPVACILAQQQLPTGGSDAAQVLGTANDIAIPRDANGQCRKVNGRCYVYIADGKSGLEIFDVTGDLRPAPSIPVQPIQMDVPGLAKRVALSADGSLAYVTFLNAVEVFDVTDPTAPIDLGTVNTSSFTRSIAIDGQSLYMANDAGGVAVVPATVYSACPSSGCAANSTTSSLTRLAPTQLPAGTYEVTVINAAQGNVVHAHNLLTLTGTATTAAAPVQSAPPAPAPVTAQSSGAGKLVGGGGGGGGGESPVGQARSPSQVNMGSGTGSGGGGTLGPLFLAMPLMGWWVRRRRRNP